MLADKAENVVEKGTNLCLCVLQPVTKSLPAIFNVIGCDYDDGDQSNYRGHIGATRSGRLCQDWSSQTPHTHSRTPQFFPNKGLEDGPYCRNPDGEPTAWCFTQVSR